MPNSTSTFRSRKPAKRVLALPDLEQAKAAVLNSLTSASGQRTYDHAITEFVAWYCSEPRLAFNRTVVLRYRIYLEQRQYAPALPEHRKFAFFMGSASPRTHPRNFHELEPGGGLAARSEALRLAA